MKLLTTPAFNRWTLLLAIIAVACALVILDKVEGETAVALLSLIAGGVLTRSGVAIGARGQAKPDDVD